MQQLEQNKAGAVHVKIGSPKASLKWEAYVAGCFSLIVNVSSLKSVSEML